MTEPNRYAVPLESLADVKVDESEQVQEQSAPPPPGSNAWSGPQLHPYGAGLGTDADGD